MIKVLVICSHRYYAPYTGYVAPFIYEQMQELVKLGCEFKLLFVKGGGPASYLRAALKLPTVIRRYRPDLIHAHYGLCGSVACTQFKIPVITTYHGSDINTSLGRRLSFLSLKRSKVNLFVSEKLKAISGAPSPLVTIPCGVDTGWFRPLQLEECRKRLGWSLTGTYILFSKEFSDYAKNYPLAADAMKLMEGAELVEFYGYTREQAVWLYNACDCALMTSFTEGSPQFIKEAVSCGCPVVSTRVGDVPEVLKGVENCELCDYDAVDVASKMKKVIDIGHLSDTHLDMKYHQENVARAVYEVYTDVLDGGI